MYFLLNLGGLAACSFNYKFVYSTWDFLQQIIDKNCVFIKNIIFAENFKFLLSEKCKLYCLLTLNTCQFELIQSFFYLPIKIVVCQVKYYYKNEVIFFQIIVLPYFAIISFKIYFSFVTI